MFGCGKRESFEDSFLKSFKLPSLQNPQKKIFFFPLTFNDFVVFLYRTSELNEATTSLDPAFFHLHQSVKSELFQTFFSKNDAANLNAKYQLEFTSQNYPKTSQNQTTIEIYPKWWSQTNYLYPFCFKESLVLGEIEFARSGLASCYRVYHIRSNDNSLPIDSSKRMILKSVCSFRKKYAYEVDLLSFVDLQELKLSLFFEFGKFPYFHLLTCLVLGNEKDNCTVPVGYLCEEAVLGSLKMFLPSYKIFGNYTTFLRELFHIAEAIQFLHDRRIFRGDIHYGNVLLFPAENEVRMKLIDFGESKTIEEYKFHYGSILKSTKESLFPRFPELMELKSFDEMFIFMIDWNDYVSLLDVVIQNVSMDEKVDFEEIKKLITSLGDNYWKLENVLQTIREHFDKEIKNCSIKEPFHYERKQIDSF